MTLTGFRRLQVVVAVAVTLLFASALFLGSGILYPGIMGVFLTPFGLAYLVLTVLALRGWSKTARVAGWVSLAVALVIGVMGFARLGSALQINTEAPTSIAVQGPGGEPAGLQPLSEAMREDFARRQRAARRVELLSALALLLPAGGALTVTVAEASARHRQRQRERVAGGSG